MRQVIWEGRDRGHNAGWKEEPLGYSPPTVAEEPRNGARRVWPLRKKSLDCDVG